jgi:hypothetical protein
MIVAIAALVVLLVVGRDELGLKDISGIVAFLIISGGLIALVHLQPVIFMAAVAVVDIYLILRIFGADITIR